MEAASVSVLRKMGGGIGLSFVSSGGIPATELPPGVFNLGGNDHFGMSSSLLEFGTALWTAPYGST
jgi:hypothetical protein